MPSAEVSTPPFAAVAAMERASMSATDAICPSAGLEPSRLSKFLVVWRTEKPLLQGTSPAPKQGPQKQGLSTAPLSIRAAAAPLLTSAILAGWEPG